MQALTPDAVAAAAGLSAYLAQTSRHSASNHVESPDIVLSACQRVRWVSGFAIGSQARRYSPPNRVRLTADCQFASDCSPPHLAATQLSSATGPRLTLTRTCTVLFVRLHGRTVPACARTRYAGAYATRAVCFRSRPAPPGPPRLPPSSPSPSARRRYARRVSQA